MNDLIAFAGSVLVLLGALFSLLGALGVWRLPDAYSRMHSASKAGALGAILILLGTLFATAGHAWFTILVAIAVLLLTAPMAAHAISRAGHLAGVRPEVGPLGDALQRDRDRNIDQ
ncbi:multisubunit sodium/proton antiporter, MrpG subunit [Halopseudomonas litoralis]|uniref:Multisubunit sodium/proton antiporter, MrpG subunit n=1 Tax=Halopseudomonas litoralis TaxID=797277 RepID=A0A1H1TQL5_9GAMM|nr:monovalent cation/H(+) antiporter subunit G [Halopseudomonas litoralis]SDS62563.1 multisubunit sodium/proton antiporter, MrpG subunit [Halopseudomonas litoralis]